MLHSGKTSWATITLQALIVGLVVCQGGLTPAQKVTGYRAGKTSLNEVIISYPDANNILQLYRVSEDGKDARKITAGKHNCLMPPWAPDGKTIVFVKQSNQGMNLWLCTPTGDNAKPLTESGGNIIPSWLPDSVHIVWTVMKPGKDSSEDSQLFIMNTKTMKSRRLFTDAEQTRFSNSMGVVSPGGKLVAFVSDRTGPLRVWVSQLDGSEAKPISAPVSEYHPKLKLAIEQKVPAWSPDGKFIAHWEGVEMNHLSRFTGIEDAGRDALITGSWNVWVVGRDGKGKRKCGRGDDPTWSPDGSVTRAFPDPEKGGPKIIIERKAGAVELPVLPDKTRRYGRFTWKP